MKKIERIALWLVSLMLMLSGIISIVWQTFGQGKIGQGIQPIEGPLAAVFGVAFVVIGAYLASVLWRSRTESGGCGQPEKPIQAPQRNAGSRPSSSDSSASETPSPLGPRG